MKDLSDLGGLRGIKEDELELMLSWRNAPKVRENMYTRHEISLSEHLAWWERLSGREDQKYFMFDWLGNPVGVVGFSDVDFVNKDSSWAFYASPSAPRGTGSRMEYFAIEYAFNSLGLNKLYCEVLEFNAAVIRLHQKFGFKVEGVLREQHLYDGSFIDVYRLGLLFDDWKELSVAMQEKMLT